MSAKNFYIAGTIICSSLLAGCMAKDVEFTEQQQRMQRCDQYIEQDREMCLRGEPVTIDDFKDDFRDYKKSKQREGDKVKAKLILPVVVKPEKEQ